MTNGIVLMGPPGVGKSTIGKRLAEVNGFTYISSGDIARRVAEYDRSTRDQLESGGMADENMMIDEMFRAIRIAQLEGKPFILDGFPRHMAQYHKIDNEKMVYYYVMCDIDLCKNRIKDRSRDKGDSNMFAIRSRMTYFTNVTIPVIYSIMEFNKRFRKIILNDINGTSHIDRICNEIIADFNMVEDNTDDSKQL